MCINSCKLPSSVVILAAVLGFSAVTSVGQAGYPPYPDPRTTESVSLLQVAARSPHDTCGVPLKIGAMAMGLESKAKTEWEVQWEALHSWGWNITHVSFKENESGDLFHLVRARREEAELICVAPTMAVALNLTYREAQRSET